jgi:photosystem II stability/assembly factor-like uncharacterized protein
MKQIQLFLLFAFFFVAQNAWAQLNWQPTNGPEGGPYGLICNNDAYAYYTTYDNLYRTTDGITWEQLPYSGIWRIGTNNEKVAAFKHNGLDNSLITNNKFIVSSDNGGTWIEGDMPPVLGNKIVISPTSILVSGGADSIIYQTINDGQSWDTLSTPSQDCNNVWVSEGNLFTGTSNKMWRLSSDGVTWELLSITLGLDDKLHNVLVDGNRIYISAKNTIWSSQDNGDTWSVANLYSLVTDANIVKIGTRIYMNIGTSALRYSDNFGATWIQYPLQTNNVYHVHLSGLARAGSRLIGTSVTHGVVYLDTTISDFTYTNNGINSAVVVDIELQDQKLWAAGGTGVFSFDLPSQTWNDSCTLPIPYAYYQVVKVSPSGAIATKYYNDLRVAVSTDGGFTWVINFIDNFAFPNTVEKLFWLGETIIVYSDFSSYIYRSTDYGVNWERIDLRLSDGFVNFNNAYYYVKYENGALKLKRSQDQGNNWVDSPAPSNLNVSKILATHDRLFTFAGTDSYFEKHQLYTSTDGQNWTFANYGLPNIGGFGSSAPEDLGNASILKFEDKYLLSKEEYGMFISFDTCKSWLPIDRYGKEVILYDSILYTPTFGRGVLKTPFPQNYGAQSSGTVFKDENGDGIFNTSDQPLTDIRMELQEPNAWYPYWFTQTDQEGRYAIGSLPGAQDTIRPRLVSPYVTAINPPYRVVTDSGSDRDFAVQMLPNITDGSIIHNGAGVPRPGFSHLIHVTTKNIGTLPLNGQIGVKLDPRYVFSEAFPAPSATIGTDSLVWNVSDLALFGSEQIRIGGTVAVTAPLGDVLQTISSITTGTTDFNPLDNVYITRDTIRGSYDPNEKKVAPSNGLTSEEILARKPLVYTIYFQNTGTYEAERVRILDQLDTALNWQTIQFLQASHNVTGFNLRPGGLLEVIFDNIALPDSNSNEPASHGFVQFSIERNVPFSANRKINNKAAIYFDFNEPIITNTVSIGVPSPSVAVDEVNVETPSKWLQIAPNPVQHICNISSGGTLQGRGDLTITDVMGRVIHQRIVANCALPITVETSDLVNGLYWVQLANGTDVRVGKLVVQKER